MAIDKSTRQHYEMQGKVKNYLGKQKMVKAPKYWKSGPEHPETELAYITRAEKDLILKKDLHGSLSRGPNIGPSGLMSLNSAGSGYGGPGPGSSGGEGQDRPQGMPAHLSYSPPTTPTYTEPDPAGDVVPGDVAFEPEITTLPTRNIHRDTKETKAEQDKLDIQQMIAKQQEEKYGPTADPTKFGETISDLDVAMSKNEEDRTIDDKLAIEDWEKAQDWDKVKGLAGRGHDFKEIQSAMEKGLLTKTDPRSMQTQGLLGRGLASLKNLIPKTGLEKSLLGKLKGSFDPKSMAMGALKSMALRKLGLGALNPILGIASLFGFDPFKGLMNRFASKPAFDVDAASKLGLYDEGISPTATAERVGEVDRRADISTAIAKGTGLGKGYEMLGVARPHGTQTERLQTLLAKDPALKHYDFSKLKSISSDPDTRRRTKALKDEDLGYYDSDTGIRYVKDLEKLGTGDKALDKRLAATVGHEQTHGLLEDPRFAGLVANMNLSKPREQPYKDMIGGKEGTYMPYEPDELLTRMLDIERYGKAAGSDWYLGQSPYAISKHPSGEYGAEGLKKTLGRQTEKFYKGLSGGGRIDKPLMGRSRDI